ncbi:MAG: hypothetical protein AUH83_09805 [Deltaproteobacteria bacterium 13_1_40CM_4_68_19]|nr:MAG: hypothetical protein AUH83_09805 [Deltaproteobacteria bacterium 13_1_40CM_4_68_19]OLD07702.1 MAG: hypothetical protein AUI90_09270 [Deltaproteobacteria bacterium 13_1_40CM_3_69_14]
MRVAAQLEFAAIDGGLALEVAQTDPGHGATSSVADRDALGPVAGLVLASLAVCALTVVLARSLISPGMARPPAFTYLFLRDEPPAAWLSCLLIVAAASLGTACRRVSDRLFVSALARDPRAFIVCATAALAASALLVYRAHPLSMDEYAPLFQARVFARGSLIAQVPAELVPRLVPPVRWFIEASADGRLVSAYWPGFALLLTPFAWLGVPWLLNPLIGGATLFAIWRIAARIWPGTAAPGWALLLAAASPAFAVNAISLYSMPAHLLASLCFALLLLEPTRRRLVLAGAVGSLALTLHNPLPHTLFALPWIAALALRPGRLRNLPALAAGYLPGVLLLGVGWFWVRAQVGAAEETAARGAEAAVGSLARLAFALPSLGSLWHRVMNLSELALWAVPGLLVLACLGAWWRREESTVRLLGASAALTLVGYMFVPYDQGHGWGYRYFHAAWGALPLLGAAALEHASAGAILRRTVLAAALGSLIAANAMRFSQARGFIDGQLRQIPTAPAPARFEVVFLRLDRGYYTIDLVQNDPFLDGSRWVLLSGGSDEDARFMTRFPNARRVVRTAVAELWQIE